MTLGRQKLQQYFKDKPRFTQASFAEAVEVEPPHISRILDGTRIPSGRLAAKIVQVTLGVVDPIDWYQPAKELQTKECAS